VEAYVAWKAYGGALGSEFSYPDLPVIPIRRERSSRCGIGQFDIRESRWNKNGWKDAHDAKVLVARKKHATSEFCDSECRGTGSTNEDLVCRWRVAQKQKAR